MCLTVWSGTISQQKTLQNSPLKTFNSLTSFPSIIFFNVVLNVWTKHSAAPLDEGWYGAIIKCIIPFNLQIVLNSWLASEGPLSLTRKYSIPWMENVHLKWSITADEVILVTGIASTISNRNLHPGTCIVGPPAPPLIKGGGGLGPSKIESLGEGTKNFARNGE